MGAGRNPGGSGATEAKGRERSQTRRALEGHGHGGGENPLALTPGGLWGLWGEWFQLSGGHRSEAKVDGEGPGEQGWRKEGHQQGSIQKSLEGGRVGDEVVAELLGRPGSLVLNV